MAKGLSEREIAADILHAVISECMPLIELREYFTDATPAQKARGFTLAGTVLRNLEPLDVVLDQFLQKSPPFRVRNILRIAAAELILEGGAPHGVVNSAVSAVRAKRKIHHLAGMTNAVCRRVAEHGVEIFSELDDQALPSMLRKPLGRAFGWDVVEDIEQVLTQRPPTDFTLRMGQNVDEWADRLGGIATPNGSVRVDRPGQISGLPGFEEGLWWVQDAAASVAVEALGEISGKTVVDMCAAPGGKTMQLVDRGAKVTAIDSSRSRMKRVRENLARTGLDAECIAMDVLDWQADKAPDAILLDAPCSATGTLRRHPDLLHVKQDWDLRPLLSVQKAMLNHGLNQLSQGGTMVFVTCSMMPQEGEAQIDAILKSRQDVRVVPLDPTEFGMPEEGLSEHGALRLRPDFWAREGGMDGFYIAKLEKV